MAPHDLLSRLVDVERLGPGVRQAHAPPVRARGVFSIRSRPFASIWSLPRSGECVETEITVDAEGATQVWRRRFGGREFRTVQWVEGDLLIERAGAARFGMRLTARTGVLHYETVRVWLGPVRLPLALAPAVTAEVRDAEGGWHVSVVVRVGPLGVVCRYSGNMALS